MKNIICCFALLFIVVGCEQENPNANTTPDNQEQNEQKDKFIADGNEHLEPIIDAPSLGNSFTNSIGMTLVYIPPGEFMMGSRDSAEEVTKKGSANSSNFTDEHPRHRVKITNGFYMGKTEVTQFQYEEIMNNNPSHFKGQNNPVEKVSWNDAVEFCRELSKKEGKTYRLPTEAEWEYACRAGTTTPFYTGETISTDQTNYNGNYVYGNGSKGVFLGKTIDVGSFQPNAFGLYDMHGNVMEWCQDWYGENYYTVSPTSDPQGPSSGSYRVLRGGPWNDDPKHCRSAFRNWTTSDNRLYNAIGFRILLDLN
ncbi:MAG: formylglycine-generating enzyme family protein [Planctomycetes bacterium]|nr:formylglycine-generating enzyme family protein [Planctomycetota bacterium]